jgi:L-ascorbate metabolism protein UlaG (beta-lactamase superfamily)
VSGELQIRRLGWAGLELTCGGDTLVVDLFEERHSMAPLLEEVTGPLPPPSAPVDAALVTHLHADHADPAAIGRALAHDGPVLRPAPAEGRGLDRAATANAEAGLAEIEATVHTTAPWEGHSVGAFEVTAVPAVDGFGDPQVSWVIEAGGRRVLHAGDTLFHGAWWPIASRLGPFDAVFLPVNGAVCDFPHRQPASPFPACLDPLQAAVAAQMLQARLAVPIHYDAIQQPGVYEQVAEPAPAFVAAASERGTATQVLEPGAWLEWTHDPAAEATRSPQKESPHA